MISYDDKLNRRLQKVTKAFNRKVNKLQSSGVSRIPKKVSIKQIKKDFYIRRDLESYLSDLERFTKRGSEDLVKVKNRYYTNYEVELFKLNLKRERMALVKEIEAAYTSTPLNEAKKDVYSIQLIHRYEMLQEDWQDLISSKKTYEQIMGRKEAIRDTMDSYLEALFVDAYTIDFDKDKIDEMKKKLLTLSPRKLQHMLENEPLAQVIFDYYHELTRNEDSKYDNTYDAFMEFYNNLDYIIDQYK